MIATSINRASRHINDVRSPVRDPLEETRRGTNRSRTLYRLVLSRGVRDLNSSARPCVELSLTTPRAAVSAPQIEVRRDQHDKPNEILSPNFVNQTVGNFIPSFHNDHPPPKLRRSRNLSVRA